MYSFFKPKDVILFSPLQPKFGRQNTLRQKLRMLQSLGHGKLLDFSYIPQEIDHGSKMTVREYLCQKTQTQSEELEKILRVQNMISAHALNKIPSLDIQMEHLTSEGRRLAQIAAAFMKPSQFLLIEDPEAHLDEDGLLNLAELIISETKHKERIILLSCLNGPRFNPLINLHVSQLSNGDYQVKPYEQFLADFAELKKSA